ncbi:hypothetical protein [Nonomuraea lactucae]|uniref:hypothetical protein n=1 Tax=Nonomuraea lactucae TaxID=2249762 RepID=UPI000DE372EB|nr:hypothetical protein [Nonomuraea lactucae]
MADIGDQRAPFDAPTTPFQRVVVPAEDETALIRRPVSRGPFLPATPPKRGLFGRVPLKVVYLVGVSITTVAALVLTFLIFSGDGGGEEPASRQVAGLASAPDGAKQTPSAVALPPVPAKKALAGLPGTASVVIGIVYDTTNGISYPRLAAPWATKSHKPFTFAQRIGKATAPTSLIGSAMVPGAAPKAKPSKDSEYRKLAARAARWTLGRQFPAGATLSWTASQKPALATGWTLGYKVTYTVAGETRVSQALVCVIEVGKAKPAMLFATIPQSGKKRWRDLNTLAAQIRPI